MRYEIKSCELYHEYNSEKIGTQWWYIATARCCGQTHEFSFWFDAEDVAEYCDSETISEADINEYASEILYSTADSIFGYSKTIREAGLQCKHTMDKLFNRA